MNRILSSCALAVLLFALSGALHGQCQVPLLSCPADVSGGGGGGSGTVTSVGITVPSWLAVTGTPVTTAGTLALAAATGQTAHRVVGTCGTATSVALCALVAGDIPSLAYLPTSTTYALGDGVAGNATGLICTTCVDTTDLASDSVTATKVGFNYAGSGSEGGPAASALSVTGFTASKCARFDGSGVLVAASGDCTAGDTHTFAGSLGASDNAAAKSDGTGGATFQASDLSIADVAAGELLLDSVGGNVIAMPASFRVGSGGPRWKNISGDLTARDAADSANSAVVGSIFAAISGGNYDVKIDGGARALVLSANGKIIYASASGLGGVTSGDLEVFRDGVGVLRVDSNGGSGALLASRVVEASAVGSGAPNALLATESRKLLTNEGASAEAYDTLPAASAGIEYTLCIADTDGARLTAVGDDTITIAGSTSVAAGYVNSTADGSCLTVVAISATRWISTSVVGTWSVN